MLTRIRAVRAGSRDQGFSLGELLVGSSLAAIAGTIGTLLFVMVSTQAGDTTTRERLGSDARVALNQVASEIRLADSPLAVPIKPDGRFEVFQPDKITFYDNRSASPRSGSGSRTPPSRVSIERVADPTTAGKSKLVMSIWNPVTNYGVSGKPYPADYAYASNYPTDPSQTMTLAQGIGNDTTKSNEAIFTYCSSAPDPAPSPTPTPAPTTTAAPAPQCAAITMTGVATKDRVLATQISSVIVRLKVGGTNYNSTRTDYQPATWLTTRVAVTGMVADPTGAA